MSQIPVSPTFISSGLVGNRCCRERTHSVDSESFLESHGIPTIPKIWSVVRSNWIVQEDKW